MRRTIVIVDDNAACAEPLQIALESLESVEVFVAADVSAALEILARAPGAVAAVITDLRMPRQSGWQLLEIMRRDAALRSVPVLVISGDSDPGLPARALTFGASAFFPKPYSPLAVKRCLEQLLA